ncbi:MAG: DUF6320 domain-containing protein [Clostridia bacterium]|nr:DUF6320 domain-containing protein [Clostridia bacterium]
MSYCVNCGVELDESAKKCALCDTEVYLPGKDTAQEQHTPFSSVPLVPAGIKRSFIASVVSICILIPNIICSLINIFIKSHGYWSVYVNCTSILVWVLFVFPFLNKKIRPYLMWAFDTVATAVYVYVFFPLQRENLHWYYNIALPVIAGVSLCVLIFIIWARKKPRHWSAVIIHLFIDICFISMISGICCIMFDSFIGTTVCLIVFLSSLSLAAFGIYCNRSRRMRAWLTKKFFV